MKFHSASIVLVLLALAAQSSAPTAGALLYRKGVLSSGKPLQGNRKGTPPAEGTAAACINCHKSSGLGTVEGRIIVPPVTERYLYSMGVRSGAEESHDGHVEPTPRDRRAYTDATLARAIREGIGPDGRTLNYLMPRYDLDDATMASLITYLKGLSAGPVPGVGEETIQFATIITPDADPVKRQGMLDVITSFFKVKDTYYRGVTPSVQSFYHFRFRQLRKWNLHIWELSGAPETWREQLRERARKDPVFAVVSGIGGKDWAPIHQFCQEESIPCIMPNVDLPVVNEDDFYDVYFSKGVLLEAQLIAKQLAGKSGGDRPRRIIQIYREDDVGPAAAAQLRSAVGPIHSAVEDRVLKKEATEPELIAKLRNTNSDDALVLWLRPKDLGALPPDLAGARQWYVSGIMGGLEDAPLAGSLRGRVHMAYPFELPANRAVLMNYPLGWFRLYKIPIVDERVQTDTYLACSIVSESVKMMLDNFVRDYLVEQIESMLSVRIIDGYYPRLSLALGQSFASKGGYIVQFARPDGKGLVAETGWVVP